MLLPRREADAILIPNPAPPPLRGISRACSITWVARTGRIPVEKATGLRIGSAFERHVPWLEWTRCSEGTAARIGGSMDARDGGAVRPPARFSDLNPIHKSNLQGSVGSSIWAVGNARGRNGASWWNTSAGRVRPLRCPQAVRMISRGLLSSDRRLHRFGTTKLRLLTFT